MPCRINACRECAVRLQVQLDKSPVEIEQRAAMMLTGMELHAVGVAPLIAMTVDALPVRLAGTKHVVVDNAFLVVFQTTLVDGEFLESDIRR